MIIPLLSLLYMRYDLMCLLGLIYRLGSMLRDIGISLRKCYLSYTVDLIIASLCAWGCLGWSLLGRRMLGTRCGTGSGWMCLWSSSLLRYRSTSMRSRWRWGMSTRRTGIEPWIWRGLSRLRWNQFILMLRFVGFRGSSHFECLWRRGNRVRRP